MPISVVSNRPAVDASIRHNMAHSMLHAASLTSESCARHRSGVIDRRVGLAAIGRITVKTQHKNASRLS